MTDDTSRIITGEDGVSRCGWCGEHADYIAYHDDEWGVPTVDDRRLFEKICLEGFQSGLSWLTILRKRDNFRRAFKDFDFEQVARFRSSSVERLLKDAGIVRHRGKIESTINNAKHALELADEFGSLAAFFWKFEPETHSHFDGNVSQTAESKLMSKELKKRGWSFVGPTTAYAFMQSLGIVNDHLPGCASFETVENIRQKFKRPDPK
ncbi:MAG: DNA-3-methyladenine glycosylase I [Rhodopirellula sp.]|nr:DNA-3-methyladenine glycosylase I [Rhodopirellula sp.]